MGDGGVGVKGSNKVPLDVGRHERGLADELLDVVLPKVPLASFISRCHLVVGLHLGYGDQARHWFAELLADVTDCRIHRVCRCDGLSGGAALGMRGDEGR